MEFATLVAPGGALWRAWVAAHWERRLKRHDYLSADVRQIAALVVERLRTINLRCVGRLLLGACRLLRWKVQHLEEEAEEVRAGLLAASTGPGLAVVASLPESALTLKLQPGEVSWWGSDLEYGQGEQLQMLEEPEVPLLEVQQSLEEGRRHVAPLETITLGPAARPQAPPTLEGHADAFGTPSAEDRRAMELLGRGTRLLTGQEEAPPPLDFLLGQSGASASRGAADLRMVGAEGLASIGAGGMAAASGRFLSSQAGGAPLLGLPGDAPLLDILEGEEGVGSTTPRGIVKRLDEEFDTPPFAHDEPRFGRGPAQSSALARMLEFSPDVPERADEGPLAAPALPAQTPRRVRRRRYKQWLDDQQEIPKAEYHDTAAITREPLCDYRIFLPHRAPQLGFTSPFADLCAMLCEPVLGAPLVGQKRRRALTEHSARPQPPSGALPTALTPAPLVPSGLAELAEPTPLAGLEAAAEEGGVFAERVPEGTPDGQPLVEAWAAMPPTPVMDDEEPEPLMPPWAEDEGELRTPRSEPGEGSAPGSPAGSAYSAPRFGGMDEQEEGMQEDLPEPGGSPLPYAPMSPLEGVEEDEEGGEEDRGEGAFAGLPASLVALGAEEASPADAPMSPAALAAEAELRAASRGAEPPQLVPGGEVLAAGADATEGPGRPPKVRRTDDGGEAEARQALDAQASQLQAALGPLDQDRSLLGLCEDSDWGVEDVARSFMGLLTLHMEGTISLTQEEAYGDIAIGRGPDWSVPAATLVEA